MKLFLLLSIIVIVFSISPEPVPVCSKPNVTLKDFPISLDQVQTFNPNDIFRGYNLNFSLEGAPNFVWSREKFKQLKSQKIPQPGLINYHMDHEDNHWGRKLVTVSQAGNSTIVRWGISSVMDAIPTLDEQATVESDPSIFCLDAVWLRVAGVILVDCYKQGVHALKNVFLYLNATSQQVIPKQIQNDMFIAYTRMTRRKIFHYVEDGQEYLMRAYFADAVNEEQRMNTYVEIMLINNPYKPWTIKVMDRSYLHQDRLSITDFKIYLGDIYILDYHTGVISFDLTPSQNIIIKGRYRTSSGYHKLGVYSNNLDNEVLLALANDHGIYEVDWTNQIRPVMMAKYSLMEGSRVSSLWVNQGFIACQLRANVTNGTNQTEEYHSTMIFDRGTRTYTNAYAVIHHSSFRAAVDFNMDSNFLLSIDEDSIDTYAIDEPVITIYPTNKDDLNKEFKFTIQAMSRNENNGHNLICSFDLVFVVVDINSMAIWPTGIQVPDTYYANYPGELIIPLNRYVVGANITYGVQEHVQNQSLDLPAHWILQQNDTIIHWNKDPSFFKYTFLRKEQFDYMGDEFFFIYSQDATNDTHVAECRSAQFSKDIYCREDSKMPKINYKIDNLTATAFLPNYGDVLHLVAVLYEEFPNEVFIYDVMKKDMFSKPIMLGKDWEGKIQSIEFLGHYLAVVLRHMKTIIFYDMKACYDHQDKVCQQTHRIDSILMGKLGVKYFSPLEIYTSDFHPFVLFVHNVDSVIILDITRQGPIVLDQIFSAAAQEPGFWKWKMAITKGHLVMINPPNTIEEYSLLELYTKRTTHQTKNYPLYNYTIPDKFDCDFSDEGDLLYIAALDKNLPADKNTVILVYRSAGPAVSALYDVFHVEGKYDDLLLDVTGTFADYVTYTTGSILTMFRQYMLPILVFEDNWNDFDFNITYTNDAEGKYHYLSKSSVKISNYPEKIVINESKLNESNYLTNEVSYNKQYKEVILDDTTWFNGTVLNYTIEGCDECGQKLRVVNHVQDKRDFYSQTDMEDYVFTPEGGVIQQFQSVIKMKHNGSIDQIAQFPSVLDGEHCTEIQHSWIYDFTLSACEHLGEIYLYTTTYTSFKPFVNGPFYSGAKAVTGLHIMEDILVLVDVDDNPYKMSREGGVMIFAMNHDPFDPQMFDEIEIIQTDDLQHAINWPQGQRAYIGNAQLVFTNDSSIYRLAITELRHGMFFVDFKWTKGRKSIQIMKVEFIDLNKLLIRANMHLPNMAFYQGIAITNEYYDTTFKYWQLEVVITTRNFHTLRFDFHIDKNGQVLEAALAKVFYRYGYYEIPNFIRHFDGYFAIIHNLPASLQTFDEMSRKVLSVYDTRERWIFNQTTGERIKQEDKFFNGTDVPAQYMLGGMRFRKGRLGFDFNFTFTRNNSDPFRGISLLVVHDRQNMIRQVAINDHLTIIAEDGIKGTQNANFKANSDFGSISIPLTVIGIDDSGITAGAIVAIVIGCLVVAVGGGYFVYRWNLKRKERIGKELEESLIDRDTLNVPKQEDEDSDEDEEQSQESDEQEQEEQEQKPAQKPAQKPTLQINQTSSESQPSETAQTTEALETPAQTAVEGQEKKEGEQ